MIGVNKVILVGNLGKDPDVMTLDSGIKKASFTLATNEAYKDREGKRVETTEWHRIVVWRRLAEIAEQYLKKGSAIYLEGSIKTREWSDDSGNKRYITEIIGDKFTMLGGAKGSTQTEENVGFEEAPTNTEDVSLDDDLPF